MGAAKEPGQGGKKTRVSKDKILELLRRQQESIDAYQGQVDQLKRSEAELKARLEERGAHSGRELERLREDLTEATERQVNGETERQALTKQLEEAAQANRVLQERLDLREAELKEAVDLATQIQEQSSERQQCELGDMLTAVQASLSTMQGSLTDVTSRVDAVSGRVDEVSKAVSKPDVKLHESVTGLKKSIEAVGNRTEIIETVESMGRELAGLAAQVREMIEPEPDDISTDDLDQIQSALHETVPRAVDNADIQRTLDEMKAMMAEMTLTAAGSGGSGGNMDEQGWQTLLDRLAAWEGRSSQALIQRVSELLDARMGAGGGNGSGGGSLDSNHHEVPVDEQALSNDPAAADRLRALQGGTR